ncbi:MAG: SDR family NAD(P)-dependent oxidoreductase, partial [Dehalococcoidia bacterium]
ALAVNLRAPIQLARALVPSMVERGSGHVVLISSLNGKIASPGASIYGATKFGLRGFGFSLNVDLRGTGVGVTTVFPGFISEAGMFHRSGVKLPKGVHTRTPDDVAAAVVKGIETGSIEIDVAPVSLRLGGWLFGISPALTGFIQRKLGGETVSERIAEAHRAEH